MQRGPPIQIEIIAHPPAPYGQAPAPALQALNAPTLGQLASPTRVAPLRRDDTPRVGRRIQMRTRQREIGAMEMQGIGAMWQRGIGAMWRRGIGAMWRRGIGAMWRRRLAATWMRGNARGAMVRHGSDAVVVGLRHVGRRGGLPLRVPGAWGISSRMGDRFTPPTRTILRTGS